MLLEQVMSFRELNAGVCDANRGSAKPRAAPMSRPSLPFDPISGCQV
jgi:hypothetical protein